MFQPHSQHLDLQSGYHVIELRDDKGNSHIVQIAVGHDACPMCGGVYPKDNLGEVDPKVMHEQVAESLKASRENMHAYAAKHGVKVK